MIAWRVDDLRLPFSDRDARLTGTLAEVVAGDEATARRLAPLDVTVIRPGLGVGRPPRRGSEPPSGSLLIGCVTRTGEAAPLLIALRQLLAGGPSGCGRCGATPMPAFDPARRERDVPLQCGFCGSPLAAGPGLDLRVRMAVRDVFDIPPEGVTRWLAVDGRVDVARLEGDAWADVGEWLGDCDVLVVPSPGADLPSAARLGPVLGVPLVVPEHVAHCVPPETSVVAVPSRTETDGSGRVHHSIDARELGRAILDAAEMTPCPPTTACPAGSAWSGNTADAWHAVASALRARAPDPALVIRRIRGRARS